MKLCDFARELEQQISEQEKDLEREVATAEVTVQFKVGKEIHIHRWIYEGKKEVDDEGV